MSTTPNWISEQNAAFDLQKQHDSEVAIRKQRELEMLEAKAPEQWHPFVKRIIDNANSVSQVKGVKLNGSAGAQGMPGAIKSCSITINNQNVLDAVAPMCALHFHKDRAGIRMVHTNLTESFIHLTNTHNGVKFLWEQKAMDGTELADYMVQQMIAAVTKKARRA
jgi:hypothetical protein